MRADLLALTADALAALTNRGLVKRATKEVDAASPPVDLDADGTIRCTFPDGSAPSLPTGGLEAGTCTCGAIGTCRHVIGLVLAYQRQAVSSAAVETAPDAASGADGSATAAPAAASAGPVEGTAPVVVWSPGDFTDADLEARIGTRLLAAARRAERAGYAARVHRPSAVDAAPRVELGSATVRFLVPHDLGFVHTDAVAGTRDDVIALAVWAFRAADEVAPGTDEAQVEVGGRPAADGGSGMEPVLALAELILRDGAVHAGQGLGAATADVRRRLDAAGLRWPLLAVGDLDDQLAAYRDRSTRYRPEATADLLAELHARHRAVVNRGAGLRSRVLGTEEAAETPLRRARLDGLGCRVRAVGEERVAEFYFAHGDSATVLVLRKSWEADEPGAVLARRRLAGTTVAALAAGNLVTESAVRSASRAVRLATARVARSTVTPSRGAWDDLPDRLVVRDLGALAGELDAMPPRMVRARVEAELVRVVAVSAVRALRYSPGHQRLDAVFEDAAGTPATITATYSPAAPGALDAIARVLAGDHGEVRFVSGVVHRTGGGIVVEPFAFAVDGALVVPDLAPADANASLDSGAAPEPDPIVAALDGARTILAEVPHRGLAHLPATYGGRLRAAAEALEAAGLRRAGAALTAFGTAIGPDPGEPAMRGWVDAYLRIAVAADLR